MYAALPIGSFPYASAALASGIPADGTAESPLILSPRDSDLATMTASTAVSSLPVTNLQNQEPAKVWRSTSATDQYVDLVFASDVAINAVAMSAFGRSASLVWRLELYARASDVGTTAAVDSGWQSVWPQSYRHNDADFGPEVALLRVTNSALYRYARVRFSDPGVDVTYIEIGRLAVGPAIQFSVKVDVEGVGLSFVPNDTAEPNGWGQIFTDPRPAQRQFNLPWTAVGQREAVAAAGELGRLRGMGGDVFCFLEPAAVELFHKLSLQGLFVARHDFQTRPLFLTDSDGQTRQAWGFVFNLIQKR